MEGSYSVLSLFITETVCSAYSGPFLWQPVQSCSGAEWGSFEAQLYIEYIDRASQQVMVDENKLGYSCILTNQGRDPVLRTWHG